MTNEIEPRKPTEARRVSNTLFPIRIRTQLRRNGTGSFAVDSLGLAVPSLLFASPGYGEINSSLNTTYIVIDSVIDRLASGTGARAHLCGTRSGNKHGDKH